MIVVILTAIIGKKGATPMPLYNRLKEYRARLGVNQQEMGTLVGVSRQTISQIERGDYSPSVTLALKLAKSLSEIFAVGSPGRRAGLFCRACRWNCQ